MYANIERNVNICSSYLENLENRHLGEINRLSDIFKNVEEEQKNVFLFLDLNHFDKSNSCKAYDIYIQI